MNLNSKLRANMQEVKNENEAVYNIIVNILNSCPSFEGVKIDSRELSIQSNDSYNGNAGLWNVNIKLDENNEVKRLYVTFNGEHNSRSRYAEGFMLSLSENGSGLFRGKTPVVELERTITPNYRFLAPRGKDLTSADIKKISKPITIDRFKLFDENNSSYSGQNSIRLDSRVSEIAEVEA